MNEVIERACTRYRSEVKATKSACRFTSVCDIGTYDIPKELRIYIIVQIGRCGEHYSRCHLQVEVVNILTKLRRKRHHNWQTILLLLLLLLMI